MQKTLHESFFSHMARYVGVGLISGSVVHAGTLGGSTSKYITLIVLGGLLFSIGTIIQHKGEKITKLLSYVLISVVISFGTGMVSGATQHYFDGPAFGAILLSLGILIAYISFVWQEYRHSFTFKRIFIASLLSVVLWFILQTVNPLIIKPIEINEVELNTNATNTSSQLIPTVAPHSH